MRRVDPDAADPYRAVAVEERAVEPEPQLVAVPARVNRVREERVTGAVPAGDPGAVPVGADPERGDRSGDVQTVWAVVDKLADEPAGGADLRMQFERPATRQPKDDRRDRSPPRAGPASGQSSPPRPGALP